MEINIRTVTAEDAPRLLEIYAPYVEKTAITFEYDVPTLAEFSSRITKTLEKYPYIAAEADGKIIGYAYAGTFKGRAAYDRAVETTIYVDMSAHRMGAGAKLYKALEAALKMQNITNLYACIAYPRQEDEFLTKDSVRFHEHFGYRVVGEFRDCAYKFGRWYDMVWAEKFIADHEISPKPVKTFPEIRERFIRSITP